ncbi:MAG: SRPBCC family protein [Solirubrobacterales bacterium]
MIEVERSRVFESTPGELWQRVGDFHGLHNWHPAITESKPSDDGTGRTLTTADGAEIAESLVSEGELTYTYRIDESPLPVQSYESTLIVREADSGAEFIWSAKFEGAGMSDDEAAELIAQFYDAGFESLTST